MKTRPLLAMIVMQCVLCAALAISLCWNIQQAIDSTARGQELYKIGLRDGELYTRAQILRAELEADIIATSAAPSAVNSARFFSFSYAGGFLSDGISSTCLRQRRHVLVLISDLRPLTSDESAPSPVTFARPERLSYPPGSSPRPRAWRLRRAAALRQTPHRSPRRANQKDRSFEEPKMSAPEDTPLCDECGNPATVIRLIRTSGYNAGSTWRVSRCDEHELPGPNRPQIHNKKLLDKIGRLILDECGNYPLMESVISFLSPVSAIRNPQSK